MDVVGPKTRSRMMAGIKGRDTHPELIVRRYLHAAGLRFRLGGCGLPGRPDLVLPTRRVAVFVHGCFWHRHPECRFATSPDTRAAFWTSKFEANVRRDANVLSALLAMDWTAMTIWECETRTFAALDELFWRIVAHDIGS